MKLRPKILLASSIALWGCSADDGLPASYREVSVPQARLASEEALLRGRDLYLAHCALCHGGRADGRGVRRNLSSQPRDFTDPHWRDRMTPRRLFYVIREGVQGTAMPSWKALGEDQTWDLVAYLLQIADRGP